MEDSAADSYQAKKPQQLSYHQAWVHVLTVLLLFGAVLLGAGWLYVFPSEVRDLLVQQLSLGVASLPLLVMAVWGILLLRQQSLPSIIMLRLCGLWAVVILAGMFVAGVDLAIDGQTHMTLLAFWAQPVVQAGGATLAVALGTLFVSSVLLFLWVLGLGEVEWRALGRTLWRYSRWAWRMGAKGGRRTWALLGQKPHRRSAAQGAGRASASADAFGATDATGATGATDAFGATGATDAFGATDATDAGGVPLRTNPFLALGGLRSLFTRQPALTRKPKRQLTTVPDAIPAREQDLGSLLQGVSDSAASAADTRARAGENDLGVDDADLDDDDAYIDDDDVYVDDDDAYVDDDDAYVDDDDAYVDDDDGSADDDDDGAADDVSSAQAMTSRVAFRQERIDPDAIFAGAPEPAPLPRPLPSTALRTGDSVVPQRRSTAVEFPLEDDDDDDDYDAADDDNYEAADDDDHEAADDDDYEAADDDDYEAADDDDYDPADDDDYEAADDDDYDTADDDDYDTADDDDYEVVARAGSGVGTSVGISSGGDGASLVLPTVDLLEEMPTGNTESDDERNDRLRHSARQLEHVFADYSIKGRIIRALPGPVVTLFELDPAPGIKASKIINLSDDVARAMRADNVRISVVRGSTVMGVELPNDLRETVALRDILADEEFHTTEANLPLVLGRNISGEPVIVDLATMPHLLIAGSTGTGKSVGLNAMILSLIFRHPPSRCRFVMIDPKMLELSVYADIPHLLTPVVTEHEKAVFALRWVVREMERRYKVMAQTGVRNIAGYNARLQRGELPPDLALDDEPFPFVVVVVDEMADLMKVAGKDVEILIQRLAQMARAAGIHIIMATQRPSVDVVTGTIKANFPTRISYTVTSRIDSRTILGEQGAETLLGRGDMLYMSGGAKIDRVHGPFVTDEDVGRVCDHLRAQATAQYVEGVTEEERRVVAEAMNPTEDADLIIGHDNDELLYDRAVMVVRRDKRASISFVQRQLQIGYNRAARMIEQMEAEGIVTSPSHTGKREVID